LPRIAGIDAWRVRVPLRSVFRISYAETAYADTVFVRVRLDDGVEGYGEACPSLHVTGETIDSVLSYVGLVANSLKGLDPVSELSKILAKIHGVEGFSAARAGLEMAVLDAASKSLGLSLAEYLGGPMRSRVYTDYTISLASPSEMAEEARRVVEKGFRVLKLKLGGPVEEDIRRVEAVREAVGSSIRLRVDANQAWSRREAVKAVSRLEEYDVELVEQPTPYWCIDCLEEVSRHSRIPVAADESAKSLREVVSLAARGVVDVINIKLMKIGGPLQAATALRVLERLGIDAMLGCMVETRLGITPAAMLAYVSEAARFIDLDSPLFLAEEPVEGGVEYGEGGLLRLPGGGRKGIGARPLKTP